MLKDAFSKVWEAVDPFEKTELELQRLKAKKPVEDRVGMEYLKQFPKPPLDDQDGVGKWLEDHLESYNEWVDRGNQMPPAHPDTDLERRIKKIIDESSEPDVRGPLELLPKKYPC